MNRRELGTSLFFGAAATGMAGVALAQDAPRLGEAARQEVMDTAHVGVFSLMASQIALNQAHSPAVREFADFEFAEQPTIARILQEVSGLPAPPLSPDQQAMVSQLQSTRGPDFETQYVTLQVDGHRKLLGIQERYLSLGSMPGMRHVAMLARGQIQEHLRLLSDIQRRRA